MEMTREIIESLEVILANMKESSSNNDIKTTKRKVDIIKSKYELDLIKFSDDITNKALKVKGESGAVMKVILEAVLELFQGKSYIVEIYDLLFDTNKIKDVEDMTAIKAKVELDKITSSVIRQVIMMIEEAMELKIEAIIQNGKKILG